MAVENIGGVYNVKIPGLTDAADIQAAFKAYHYGAYTSTATTAGIAADSMAYWLKTIEDDIALLEARPSSGGDATSSAPSAGDFTPSGIPDGYIWVDLDGAMTSSVIGATAIYNNNAPTSGLTSGIIWVDKDATTSTSGNPFIPSAIIAAKGDLLAGSANDTVTVLTVGSNGQYLKADSSTTSGLAWGDPGDLTAVSAGTGITVTSGTGPIPSIAIDTATVVDLNTAQTLTNKTFSFSSNTVTTTLAQLNTAVSDADVASLAGSETLSNKTVTSGIFISGTFTSAPAINRPTITGTTQIAQIIESAAVTSYSATGTAIINVLDQGAVVYWTGSASSNWIVNVRGSSTTSLLNMLTTGQSITIASLVTNGAGAARYLTSIEIDGSSVTSSTKWQGGSAPTSGNTSSIDIYSITAIKVANTSTISSAFTVLAGQTQFA
jgi:hypothetical protein